MIVVGVGAAADAALPTKVAAEGEDFIPASGKDESDGNMLVFTGEEIGLEFTTIVVLFISHGILADVDADADAEAEANSD